MIQIEKIETYGWEAAIRGMRNPMNSWELSDSFYDGTELEFGEKDLNLAKALYKAGTDHSKFLRMIHVTMDITAPLYWWKEYDTYKVGTVANSCSTMHKIHDKKFVLGDFSNEHILNYETLNDVIGDLNVHRRKFLETNDKKYWYAMIQELPSCYNQKRTVDLNYQTILNMYFARRFHKLEEWQKFCMEMRNELPYLNEFILTKE